MTSTTAPTNRIQMSAASAQMRAAMPPTVKTASHSKSCVCEALVAVLIPASGSRHAKDDPRDEKAGCGDHDANKHLVQVVLEVMLNPSEVDSEREFHRLATLRIASDGNRRSHRDLRRSVDSFVNCVGRC
jgi:hypothetical protein